jgi:hypothetical protein
LIAASETNHEDLKEKLKSYEGESRQHSKEQQSFQPIEDEKDDKVEIGKSNKEFLPVPFKGIRRSRRSHRRKREKLI